MKWAVNVDTISMLVGACYGTQKIRRGDWKHPAPSPSVSGNVGRAKGRPVAMVLLEGPLTQTSNFPASGSCDQVLHVLKAGRLSRLYSHWLVQKVVVPKVTG